MHWFVKHSVSQRSTWTVFLLVVALLAGCTAAMSTNTPAEAPKSLRTPTVDALLAALRAENAAQIAQITDLRRQVQTLQAAIADRDEQLAAAQSELDTLRFGAERLLAQSEAALRDGDLEEARRLAALLDKEHPFTAEASRAAEIVTQLEAVAAAKEADEQARIAAATAKMKVNTDEVRSITFYSDASTNRASLSDQVYLYIGKNSDKVWLRLYVQYFGDEWLFVNRFTIKAGDQVFEIRPGYSEFQRDNSAYSVWEWYDGAVTRKEIEMIQALIAADDPVVRFNGQTYYSDYVVTNTERQAMQNVLDAFVALGGDLANP